MKTTGMVGLLCLNTASKLENKIIFLKRFIAQKACTAFSRTSYKIVPLTNLKNTYTKTQDKYNHMKIKLTKTYQQFGTSYNNSASQGVLFVYKLLVYSLLTL